MTRPLFLITICVVSVVAMYMLYIYVGIETAIKNINFGQTLVELHEMEVENLKLQEEILEHISLTSVYHIATASGFIPATYFYVPKH